MTTNIHSDYEGFTSLSQDLRPIVVSGTQVESDAHSPLNKLLGWRGTWVGFHLHF